MKKSELPFTIEEFKQIYSQVPRLTAMCLITNQDNEVLLTLRDKYGWEGQWAIPGVTVYYGEEVKDAVHRSASEELGVKIEIKSLLGYIEYPTEEKERGYGYTVCLSFLCKITEGEPKSLDAEDLRYFSMKNLPKNVVKEEREFLLEKFG